MDQAFGLVPRSESSLVRSPLLPVGRRIRVRTPEGRRQQWRIPWRSSSLPLSRLERSRHPHRTIYGPCGARRAFKRPARQCFQAGAGSSIHLHQKLFSSRRFSRWLARAGHRLHGGSLCFPKGVPYTALMEVALVLVFGLIIGSFLNVVIVRLPQGISIST